ncbi:MAG TPA: cupin domain-containing protein [Burkholderiaceae bacterium]|nr:cupin domain-containing protein [Burkholderiaceae bacterium]
MKLLHATTALLSVLLACGALLAATAPAASAHETVGGTESVKPLIKQALPDAPGKQAMMVTVSYAPGQASEAHVHPGSVFAYVAEGEVVSQLEGQPPVTYKTGDAWYEPPHTPHLVSRNASQSKPARLIVWLVTNEGEALKRPYSR